MFIFHPTMPVFMQNGWMQPEVCLKSRRNILNCCLNAAAFLQIREIFLTLANYFGHDFLFQNGKLMKKREALQIYLQSVAICAFCPLGRLPAVFMPQLLENYHFNQFLRDKFRAAASLWGMLKVFSVEFKGVTDAQDKCSNLSGKYIP